MKKVCMCLAVEEMMIESVIRADQKRGISKEDTK